MRSCQEAFGAVSEWDGGYVNGNAEPDDAQTRDSYGPKYERLARIKAEYDPGNVFHPYGNIPPA